MCSNVLQRKLLVTKERYFSHYALRTRKRVLIEERAKARAMYRFAADKDSISIGLDVYGQAKERITSDVMRENPRFSFL